MTSFSAEELGKHANSLRALARDLLSDDGLAEDVVQDACVTALTRPPAGSLGAWLRAVVTNRAADLQRSEQRRRSREQRAARQEASEDADAAGQMELQQDILTAVRSLRASYRTAVWMRYYEHRSPSQIATVLGEPVKTVKTRLARALQMLREKLDARYGERSAWLPVLLPLAGVPGRVEGLGAATAAGVLLMQSKYLVAVALLTLALVGGASFLLGPDALPVPATALADANVKGGTEQALANEAQPRRTEAPVEVARTAPTSPFGSLVVRVRWHDGEPAAQVAIRCDVEGDPQLDRNEVRMVSDDKGIARIGKVHAGALRLSSERGGKMAAQVAPGSTCEVDFVLPRGIDVTGTVVDEGQRPVASASVVLVSPHGGWLGGNDVAVTDAIGEFSVRSVDPTWSLGARRSGHSPSALVDLEDVTHPSTATTVQVHLRLGAPGAALSGTVVDQEGAGIPEATVAVGYGMSAHFEAGHFREQWSPHVVTTGKDGTFHCEGVAPGLQEIVAWAEGCTRAQDTVQCVAGQTATISLALVRGVTVKGTVRNQAGEVMADVVVRSPAPDALDEAIGFAMHESAREKRPHTRTDADGGFILRGIPPGHLRLVAAKPAASFFSYEAFCQVALVGRVGEELTWDPVLVTAKQIRVRVVDAVGAPAHLSLTARAEESAGLASLLQAPVPERKFPGTYVISGCADVPYTLSGRLNQFGAEPRWVYRTGVIPGGPEVVLRLPPMPSPGALGEITGRIADRWQRLSGRSLSVALSTSGMARHLPVDGNQFSAKDVEPGRYFIYAQAGKDPILVGPWFDLQPGQHLDLGDLALEPSARIRVVLRAPAGADLVKPAVSLQRWYQWWPLRSDGNQFAADNVTVGRYQVNINVDGWHAAEREVELLPGQDHVVELDLARATRRRFDFVLPMPDQWQRCVFTLRDSSGNVISQMEELTSAGVGVDPQRWQAQQPFGLFTLEAVLDGKTRSWPVDLRDPATGDRPLLFSLR